MTDKVEHNELALQKVKDQLLWIIKGILIEKDTIIGTIRDKILIFVPNSNYLSQDEFEAKCLRQCEQIVSNANNFFNYSTITIGVGNLYYGIYGLRKSHYEALDAIKIGKKLKGHNPITLYSNLGIYRLLGEAFQTKELGHFYNDTMGSLISFDRENNAELIPTLDAYFECDCNIEQTSRRLFVHYNTVVQRLKRIETVSNLNIKSPEDKLLMQIGLKIGNLLSKDDLST